MNIDAQSIGINIKDKINKYEEKFKIQNIGKVIRSGDGIVKITGLQGCQYGELLEFQNDVFGIALNLEENSIGAVLLNDEFSVSEGDSVTSTGSVVQVPVGEGLLGRVIDPLGNPLDGGGQVKFERYDPIETEAPSILDRQSVKQPLQTGLLAIDSMIPIGKGQRELIIGDRQTGKTAIALDTILNQKDKDVICIYVSIGQKASTVSQIISTLRNFDALSYSIVVSSTASDSAPMQYIAPYSGCTMAEFFMNQGKDVLIVYDDLSKHAVAYRTMSLLLRRPPGREAYPGDVFYLHSRLLERAAKLSDKNGAGSLTALPIVETQAGDISGYIPTNVISITDGQLFLESELFNSGSRPALNVGLSVSRVGRSAQSSAMKKVSGGLRLDLAQYRELEVFSQFGSELDSSTRRMLAQGQRVTEILKQHQYEPMNLAAQVILLYAVTNKLLLNIKKKDVGLFKESFIDFVKGSRTDIIDEINSTKELSDSIIEDIKGLVDDFKNTFFKEQEYSSEEIDLVE